eukprot:jgi/Mesen1/7820/ME000415S07019
MGADDNASNFANAYSWCGFLGACIFPASLIPQLIKTFRTKSAEDISYVWQIFFIFGIVSTGIYAVGYELWPIFYPLLFELSFIVASIVMKVCYGRRIRRERENAGVGEEEPEVTPEVSAEVDEKREGKATTTSEEERTGGEGAKTGALELNIIEVRSEGIGTAADGVVMPCNEVAPGGMELPGGKGIVKS